MQPVGWLSSQFSRSVDTRRRYGLLRMIGVHPVCFFRAPLWCPSGGGGTREAGGDIVGSLRGRSSALQYWVSTPQIRRGRRAAQSSTSQGSAEPLCARIKGVNREVSEGKTHLWPRAVLFLRRPTRSGERAQLARRFSGMHRALDGWMLARAPASSAQGLHHHRPR